MPRLAIDHVLGARREATPCRCDCYLSFLPPYGLPFFPTLHLLPAIVLGRHSVSPPQSVLAGSPKPMTHAHWPFSKTNRYPKALASFHLTPPTLCLIAAPSFPFTAMTEYDYSPAAYEKYISTQHRVSDWVSSQSDHTQSYGNPFMPSSHVSTKPLPKEQSSRKPVKSPPRSRSSTTSAPSSTTTPTKPARQPPVRSHTTKDVRPEQRHAPIRSMTMPPNQTTMVYPVAAGQMVVLPTSHKRHDRHDKHDRRRSSPHRSSSNKSPSKSSHHSSRYDRSHHHRSSSTSRAYTTDRDASGRKIIQLEPGSHNRVLHLPPPQLGEQYVIIPAPGEKLELVVRFLACRLFATYHRGSSFIRTRRVTK